MSLALIRLFPERTAIPFISWRMGAFVLSVIAVAFSVFFFATRDLNYGIDFTGGVLVDIETPGETDENAIREALAGLGLGGVEVQSASDLQRPNAVLIRVQAQAGEGREGELAQQAASAAVIGALTELYPDINLDSARVEVVGSKVSGELVRAGVIAIVIALVMMLAYIWFRFEWQYSLGAVVALVHDVVLTIGMFAVTQIEFNLSIVAAILTIVGYSMNDTVVVYDRIRENLRKYKRVPLREVLNMSINDTLSRTTMTSVTTLLALTSLFFLGGEVLRGFSFAMIWGVVVGTYSSIFIAAPILLLTNLRRDAGEAVSAE